MLNHKISILLTQLQITVGNEQEKTTKDEDLLPSWYSANHSCNNGTTAI